MKEPEQSQGVSEFPVRPLTRFGIEQMQAFLPKTASFFDEVETEFHPFSEVRLVPPLMAVIQKKRWKVLEETLLLLSKYGKVLPAISWIPIIAALEKGSLHFIHRETVFPGSVTSFLSPQQQQTILPPTLKIMEGAKEYDMVRAVQYYFVHHRELRGETWSSFWAKANAKSKTALLSWMQKLPPDIDTDWTVTQPTKGKTLLQLIKSVQYLQKGSSYQVSCNDVLEKVGHDDDLQNVLGMLDVSDLAISYQQVNNKKLPLETFTPAAQYQLLEGTIMHRNIAGALHLIERAPSLTTHAPVNCPTLPPVYLSQWVSGLLILKSPPAAWILNALKTSDAYLTPEASQRLVDFGLRQWHEEVEVEIWTDILTWIATKGDPKVLAAFLHFKEKHPFIDSSIQKVLSSITDLLYLRLQVRRSLAT